jgi:hypothetical protein
MNMKAHFIIIFLLFGTFSCRAQQLETIDWTAEHHPEILEILGSPTLIRTPLGPAIEFNGRTDGIFLDSVPVEGMEEVTIEMIFKPYPDSPFEQRFMHMGAYSGARIMFESRVKKDNMWYFDAFIHLGTKAESAVLIDSTLTHPTGRWYNLALVAGTDGLTSYVNGVQQCTSDLGYKPVISEGKTSIGVRQNLVCWFKGAIFRLRITSAALSPDQFLTDHLSLNGEAER